MKYGKDVHIVSSRAAQTARDLTMFEHANELCEVLRCAQDDRSSAGILPVGPMGTLPIDRGTRIGVMALAPPKKLKSTFSNDN